MKVLNNKGLAVAADMGLLLASLLENEMPSLHWAIGIGPKSYHSYNLPVLKEFANGAWDLVFSSVNKNSYSLNELKRSFDWLSFFTDLKSKAK